MHLAPLSHPSSFVIASQLTMRILHHGGREYRAPLQSSHCTPSHQHSTLSSLRCGEDQRLRRRNKCAISFLRTVPFCIAMSGLEKRFKDSLSSFCLVEPMHAVVLLQVATPHESPFMRCWNEEQWLVSKDWIKVFPEFHPDIENQPITQTDASRGNRLFASHLFFSRRR